MHRQNGTRNATRPARRRGKTSPALVVGLVLGMVLLAGGVMFVLVKFVGRGDQPAPAPPGDATPKAVVLPDPAIPTTATAMLVLFKDNQAAAEAQYKTKVVDVEGTVFAKGTNLAGERAVTLEGGAASRFGGVRCAFPAANYFQWDQLEVGQTVKIRGRCEGLESDVVLRESAVLPPTK